MHVTMVKKKLRDGSDCRKCAEATEHLRSRGLLDRIDEVVWALEDDPDQPGHGRSARGSASSARPSSSCATSAASTVYTSVLQLVRDRFGQSVSTLEQARAVDPDDVGGI